MTLVCHHWVRIRRPHKMSLKISPKGSCITAKWSLQKSTYQGENNSFLFREKKFLRTRSYSSRLVSMFVNHGTSGCNHGTSGCDHGTSGCNHDFFVCRRDKYCNLRSFIIFVCFDGERSLGKNQVRGSECQGSGIGSEKHHVHSQAPLTIFHHRNNRIVRYESNKPIKSKLTYRQSINQSINQPKGLQWKSTLDWLI